MEALGKIAAARLDYQKAIELENQKPVIKPQTKTKDDADSKQPNTLKEELEQFKAQQAALEKQLALAQAELKDNKNRNEQLEAQRKQLEQIQRDQAVTQSLLTANQNEKVARKAFQKYPNLWRYYRQVQLKLEEIFMGCKTVASGLVAHQQKGTLGEISSGISLLGKLVSLVPVIGNSAGGVLAAGAQALNKVDYQRQLNILKEISALGSLMELVNISEQVARELTTRYRDQLELLCSVEEESQMQEARNGASRMGKIKSGATQALESAKEKILAEQKKAQSEQVAEYGVLKILEVLLDGQIAINNNRTIEDQLITEVMRPSKLSKKEQLSRKLGVGTLINRNQQEWSLVEIYQAPVVKTEEGRYYSHEQSDGARYGYRYASAQEAESWGLTRLSEAVAPSKAQVVPINNYQPAFNSSPSNNQGLELTEEKKASYHTNITSIQSEPEPAKKPTTNKGGFNGPRK